MDFISKPMFVYESHFDRHSSHLLYVNLYGFKLLKDAKFKSYPYPIIYLQKWTRLLRHSVMFTCTLGAVHCLSWDCDILVQQPAHLPLDPRHLQPRGIPVLQGPLFCVYIDNMLGFWSSMIYIQIHTLKKNLF